MHFVSILLLMAVLSVSCSKKESSSAKIKIQFDQSVLGNIPYSKNDVQQSSNNSGPTWGLPDPTSLGVVHCYAVFVHGNQPELSNSACQLGDTSTLVFGPRAGFFSIDEPGEIEVLAGLKRTIYLLGMSSADGTCQAGFDKDADVDDSNHSNPFVIGKATVDLTEGVNFVEVPLKNEFNSANKILDCNFFDENDDLEPANLQITESEPYDFGNLITGNQSSITITLENTGSAPASNIVALPLTSPFSYTGAGYPGTGGTCGSTLESGNSCLLDISFSPSVSGSQTVSLDLSYNDGSSNEIFNYNLQGVGQLPALLNIATGPPYVFDPQPIGNYINHSFNITNNGEVAATNMLEAAGALTTPFSFPGGYPGSGGDCGVTLNPGASCTIEVQFAPVSSGTFNDDIEISYDTGMTNTSLTFNLQGSDTTLASLTMSGPDPYSFPATNTGATSSYTFTVNNIGGYTASGISEVGLVAPFSVDLGSSTCGTTLPPGGNCTLVVDFSPLVTGPIADIVVLDYNDGQVNVQLNRNVDGLGQ